MGRRLIERANVMGEACANGAIRFDAMHCRPKAGAYMRELTRIGANIDNKALRVELDIPIHAIFGGELIKPRFPAFAIKFPAIDGGSNNLSVGYSDLRTERVRRHRDPNMTTDVKGREQILAQKFPADLEG